MATDGRGKGKPWTEAEKLAILFQIIEKSGPINYEALELPEGRTKKAVQVMIDREKGKVRALKATAEGEGAEKIMAEGEGEGGSKKRKTNEKTDGTKKAKKKKAQVKAEMDEKDEEDVDGAVGIKVEVFH